MGMSCFPAIHSRSLSCNHNETRDKGTYYLIGKCKRKIRIHTLNILIKLYFLVDLLSSTSNFWCFQNVLRFGLTNQGIKLLH